MDNIKDMQLIGRSFGLEDEVVSVEIITNGHINSTYLVTFGTKQYIMQKVNRYVFPDPEAVMYNIDKVTHHLRKKIKEDGGDPERETLRFLKNDENKNYIINEDGSFWRMCVYLDGTTAYNTVADIRMLKNAGLSFGKFQKRLADFPVEQIGVTIEDFHNTPKRLDDFFDAVNADTENRAVLAKEEIEFFLARREMAGKIVKLQREGKIPVRVTHNDTKYNNILIDNRTFEAVCVIDLDTVMPGISCYDFGDAIRFAASTASEDETNLDKVRINMEYFKAFTEGFIGGADGFFSDTEVENMALGAINITIELASRFLADYLQGDKYFKICHKNHNLERAKNQIKLAKDMEDRFDEMQSIVVKNHYK